MSNKSTQISGMIAKYFQNRGFGFIETDSLSRGRTTDVFFHISNVSGREEVEQGEYIEFVPYYDPDEEGWAARNANILTSEGFEAKEDGYPLSQQDIIELDSEQIETIRRDGVCPLNNWNNISSISIHSSELPENSDNAVYARITGFDGRIAEAGIYTFELSNRLKPGEEVEVIVNNPPTISFTRYDGRVTGIKELVIPNTDPGEKVLARVLKVGQYSALAEVTERIADGPSIGELIMSDVVTGAKQAQSQTDGYKIELRDESILTGTAEVKIVNISENLIGEIESYEDGPSPGDRVRARVEYGEPPVIATEINERFEIRLEEPVLCTGEVSVEITELGNPMKGKIDSYETHLPKIGDVIEARVSKGDAPVAATEIEDKFEVILEQDTLASGIVTVEIKSIDEKIKGVIESYRDVPSEGSVIDAEVIRRTSVAKPADEGDYRIELESRPLAWGNIEVKIKSIGSDKITGEIVSHHESLPVEGEVVKGIIREYEPENRAEPFSGKYTIFMVDDSAYTGTAEIKIVEISDRIKGEIEAGLDRQSPKPDRGIFSPSKKREINRKKL